MSESTESIVVPKTENKEEKYRSLLPQLIALVEGERDMIANLANTTSALMEAFNFFWVGFYIVRDDQLVLGPFQGPIACTRISLGRGVCGKAWKNRETIVVPDVNEFEGHIACNSASKSEIVIPGIQDGEVLFVLDVDSDKLNDFDETDKVFLEKIVATLIQGIG